MTRLSSVSLLLVILWTVPLGAQDSTATADNSRPDRLHRAPGIAQALGVVLPGAGHLYAGEYSRWYFTQVIVVSSLATGEMFLKSEGCTWFGGSCTRSRRRTDRILGAALVGYGAWTWISSARDAPRAAARANERHARKTRKVTLFVDPVGTGNQAMNVGAAVRW